MAHSIAAAAKRNNDELYTPEILVKPLIPHLSIWVEKFHKKHKRDPIMLAPFDTSTSNYVQILRDFIKVKNGHIITYQDFFTYDYGDWDICISNPPFSLKKVIWEHLYKLNKPFALLSNVMCLNYMEIGSLFADNPIQLLLFDKRVSFNGNPSSFASGYFCNGFLERDLIFEHLPHCNTGKNFEPSEMAEEISAINNGVPYVKKVRYSVQWVMPMKSLGVDTIKNADPLYDKNGRLINLIKWDLQELKDIKEALTFDVEKTLNEAAINELHNNKAQLNFNKEN